MASNKITLTISVDDNGSLKVVAKNAKTASKAVDGLTASVDKTSKATKRATQHAGAYDKQAKGVGHSTNNSTKAFAKQAQGIGGTLVPAYATLAANIFAVTAAFGALQRAAAMEQLMQGLIQVGSAAGRNLPYVADQLKAITGAAVSTKAAMSAVALGTSAGFSTSQLEDLTRVAKGASLALGRDMEDALTRLVKGTAKLEPEILDELGIMVRLDTAAAKYAVTLGKSVTQLTQFERRQAFLNETLEQGLSKFGEIAETIDPNPYDQLAATFDDLTKSLFRLLNTGLGPLAEFLGQNKIALTGAMILFGSTIIGKIVPALDLAIEKQVTLARVTAASAKLLGAQSKTQLGASVKAIGDSGKLDSAPKAISAMSEQYKDASISVDQLKANLVTLERGEKSRTQWITRWGKDQTALQQANKTASATEIADNNKKIKAIQDRIALGKIELEQQRELIAMHKTSLGLSGIAVTKGTEELRKGATSRMATSRADTLTNIGAASAFGGFKEAFKGIGPQFKEIEKVEGAFSKVAIGARAAATSVGFFGRALLTAIPVIGLIVLGVSVLWPLLEKLWGGGAVAKASKEVEASFASVNDIGKSLVKTIDSNKSAAEKYIATLRVEVGLMDQLAAGLKKVQDAKRIESEKELNDLIEKRTALEIKMEGAGRRRSRFRDQDTLANVNRQIRETILAGEELEQSRIVHQMDTMLTRIGVLGPSAVQALSGTVDAIDKLKARVKAGEFSGAGGVAKLAEEFTKTTSSANSVISAVDGDQEALSAYNKEINKLKNKDTTPFDDLINSFEVMTNQIEDASVLWGLGTAAWLQRNKEFADGLRKIYNEKNPVNGWLEEMVRYFRFDPVALMKEQLATMKQQRDTILETAGSVKILEAQLKNLSGATGDNPELLKQALNLEEQILARKRQGIQSSITLSKIASAERTSLKRELDALNEQSNLLAKRYDLEVNIASIKEQQRVLGYEMRSATANQEILRAKQAILAINLKMASNAANQDVSPVDALKLFKQEQEERVKSAIKMYSLKVRGIGLEYALLAAQVKLEMIKAEGNTKALAMYDSYLGLISEAGNASVSAAGAGLGVELAGIGAEDSDKERAVLQQKIAQANEASANAAERYRIAGAESLALTKELTNNTDNQKRLEAEIGVDKALGLDFSQKTLEAEKLKTDELKLQVALLETAASRAERLAGSMQGIAVGVVAAFTAGAEVLGDDKAPIADKMAIMTNALNPLLEQLKSISPEGEVMSAAISGIFSMSEAFAIAFEETGTKVEKFTAGLQLAGSIVNALGSIQAAQSRAAIAGIDSEIAAEKARDGQSAASTAKIVALEKKKEAAKRKAFEQNKKMQMAQTIISTITAAMGAYSALASIPYVGPALGAAAAAAISVIGAAQLAAIAGTSYEGGGSLGAASGPTAVNVGERSNVIDLAKSRSPSAELAYTQGASGTGDGATNFRPGGFAGLKQRASGGSTGFMVGEQGPELFVPSTPGRIIPADETAKMGSNLNVTFQVNAIDTQDFQQVLNRERGNIIGMIREAANANGEFFLEGVSTQSEQARNKAA